MKKRDSWVALLLAAVTVTLCVLVLVTGVRENRAAAAEQRGQTELDTAAALRRDTVTALLEEKYALLESLAGCLGAREQPDFAGEREYANAAALSGGLGPIVFADTEGNTVDTAGRGGVSAAEDPLFRESIQGTGRRAIGVSGARELRLAVPVRHKNALIGVLLTTLEPSEGEKLLVGDSFGGQECVLVTDRAGNILLRNGNAAALIKGAKLLGGRFARNSMTDETITELYGALQAGESGGFVYEAEGPCRGAFLPLGMGELCVFSMAPETAAARNPASGQQLRTLRSCFYTLSLLTLLGALYYIIRPRADARTEEPPASDAPTEQPERESVRAEELIRLGNAFLDYATEAKLMCANLTRGEIEYEARGSVHRNITALAGSRSLETVTDMALRQLIAPESAEECAALFDPAALCSAFLAGEREKRLECTVLTAAGERKGVNIRVRLSEDSRSGDVKAYLVIRDRPLPAVLPEPEPPELPVPEKEELPPPETVPPRHVFARTFGYFDLFVDGEPVHFTNPKEKELLAILIDRNGGTLTAEEAISILWEDEPSGEKQLSRYRKLASRLKATLAEAGCDQLLITVHGVRHADVSAFECDYYEAMASNPRYMKLYQGIYMMNYSWAEETTAALDRLLLRESAE